VDLKNFVFQTKHKKNLIKNKINLCAFGQGQTCVAATRYSLPLSHKSEITDLLQNTC
jgi:acyl-CoA reductase-like NAD-dependent aldehyde dehydrogenase